MSAPAPVYLSGEDLAVWLKALEQNCSQQDEQKEIVDSSPHPFLLIIDVRGEEEIFEYGFIKSSKHIPSDMFADDDDASKQVSEILNSTESVENSAFVFHCQFSQQRGPFCAKRFLSLCSHQDKHPSVYILQGGFDSWKRLSSDSELVSHFTMPPA